MFSVNDKQNELTENHPQSKSANPHGNVVRSGGPQPLKVLNIRAESNSREMSKQGQGNVPKQKISLEEYKARKSKSPKKPDEPQASPTVTKTDTVNTAEKAEANKLICHGGKAPVREERVMSTDDVHDVSLDLANMSIDTDSTSYLDDKTGQLSQNGKTSATTDKSNPGQTLSKSVSSSDVRSKPVETKTLYTASKSSSSLTDNKSGSQNTGHKKNYDLSLAERLKQSTGSIPSHEGIKHKSNNSNEQRPMSVSESDDVIDLTEDDGRSHQANIVKHKQPFQAVQKQPMQSFEGLNKQPMKSSVTGPADQSQQWTQMRSNSAEQGAGLMSASVLSLKKSLSSDMVRKAELKMLLEKQKTVIASVKMSDLPDKGERLMKNVESLAKNLLDLTQTIETKKVQLSTMEQKQGQFNPPQRSTQPQVIKVYPNGSQVSQASGATSAQPISGSQPRMIKIYPNGSQQVLQPGVVGGNHQPHNPDNLKQTTLLPHVSQIPPHILQQMYAANPQAMQLYGGRMTTARLREVGSITKDAIEKLHKQLETCPKSTEELEDPKGVLVPLMVHQRQGLMWLVWRERQSPSGGILADDMGLGKTLTMISLILKQNELKKEGSDEEKRVWLNRDKQLEKMDKSIIRSSASLVICPASLIHQWKTEIERRCKPGLLRVCLYHGPNREKNILKLANYDVILTTYNIVSKEVVVGEDDKKGEEPVKDDDPDQDKTQDQSEDKGAKKEQPNIMRIAWERIILDEAHNIKNHKSLQSRAVCRLRAGFRWALTGTPIQNDLLDMYSLLRFLRCTPFDEYKVWKRQVDTRNNTGQNRLNVLVKSLLLRRTKTQTNSTTGKALVPLPDKTSTIHELDLSPDEKRVYDKIYAQSRNVLKEYLKRHEDKELLKDDHNPSKKPIGELFSGSNERRPGIGQSGASSSDSANQGTDNYSGAASTSAGVKGQQILVMLLRLRQCCCHLSLMKDALDDETQENEGLELTLEEQLMDLMLNEDGTKEPIVKKSSQIFMPQSASTKIHALIEELRKIHKPANPKDRCKSVIVSQWTKMLEIVIVHLRKMDIPYSIIKGDIPPKKRMEAVDQFNNDADGPQVMLVSLRAGGCGLNLIGGNHLFLVDSHWNPALEDQACDRIYRVGQTKSVYVHRFLCKDTVEEKIQELQKRKQTLAKNVLSGSAASNTKLTLNDLRLLFNV